MNPNEAPFNTEQSQALRSTRLRWALALLLTAPLPFAILPITGVDWLEQQPDSASAQTMGLAILITAAAVLGGLFARNQAYKAGWRGNVVAPDAYTRGNTLFFTALATGAAALFLISVYTGYPAPTLAAALVFIGLLVFNFPSGKPMHPAPPRLDGDPS